MRLQCTVLVLVLLTGGVALGLDLPDTPIRDAMNVQLALDEWDETPVKPDADTRQQKTGTLKPSGRKSVARAAVYSALLPGAGEFYLGKRKKARVFFVGEALTWLGYAAFTIQGDWKRDDYVKYGNTYAGASLDDKDDEFLDMVGFYDDIYSYNTFGRAWDPERTFYPDTPEYHWKWQSAAHQRIFRDLKNDAAEADRRAKLMLGIAVASRIISVIDSIRDAIRHNRNVESGFSNINENDFKLAINPLKTDKMVSLTFYPSL